MALELTAEQEDHENQQQHPHHRGGNPQGIQDGLHLLRAGSAGTEQLRQDEGLPLGGGALQLHPHLRQDCPLQGGIDAHGGLQGAILR